MEVVTYVWACFGWASDWSVKLEVTATDSVFIVRLQVTSQIKR